MTYGLKTTLGISFQNSYGTPLTNSNYFIPIINESLAVVKAPLIQQNMQGRFDEGATFEGLNSVPGTIELEAVPIGLGALFKAFFGPSIDVQSGAIFAHTYKPRTVDFDNFAAGNPCTLTKDLGDGGSAHQFYDMVASKLSLSVANGQFFKAKLDFMGGKYQQVVAPAASYPTGKPFTWDVISVTMGTSLNNDLVDLTVELDENLDNKYTLGVTKTPSRTKRKGFRTMAINGTIIFDNQAEYQQFLSQAERELIMTLTGPTQIQSGYFDQLVMKVPLFRYVDFKPVAKGPDKVQVGFASRAVFSVTSATAFQITLTNTQPAY